MEQCFISFQGRHGNGTPDLFGDLLHVPLESLGSQENLAEHFRGSLTAVDLLGGLPSLLLY